jgi:hypothetical protein
MSAFSQAAASGLLETFSRQMSVPELTLCPLEALGIFTFLSQAALEPGRGNWKHQRSAFDVTSEWISLRRTHQQVQKSMSSTCNCSSASSEFSTHYLGETVYQSRSAPGLHLTHGQILVQECTLAISGLQEEKSKFPPTKLYHLSSRASWPCTSKQILPHGPDQTVCGYMDWLASDNPAVISQIMKALTMVLSYAWPLAVPAIVRTQMFLEHFINAPARWQSYLESCKLQNSITYGVQAQLVHNVIAQLTQIMRIISVDCSDPTTAAAFFNGYQSEIVVRCDGLITIITKIGQDLRISQNSAQIVKVLVSVITTIYKYFPGHRESFTTLVSNRRIPQSAIPTNVPNFKQWNTLAKTLDYQRRRESCSAPGCYRTTEELGRRLRSCSWCLWLPYCSRRCQKNSWRRDDGLQHRDVCGRLRHICLQHNISPSQKPSVAMQNIPTLTSSEVTSIESINSYFAALSTRELKGVTTLQ